VNVDDKEPTGNQNLSRVYANLTRSFGTATTPLFDVYESTRISARSR